MGNGLCSNRIAHDAVAALQRQVWERTSSNSFLCPESCYVVNTISPRNGRCSVICIYACLDMQREKILISDTRCVAPQGRSSEQSLLQAVFNSSTEAVISGFIELGYSALQNSFAFAPRRDQLCINHSLLLLVETTHRGDLFQNVTILACRIILTAGFILTFRCTFTYIQRRYPHVSWASELLFYSVKIWSI